MFDAGLLPGFLTEMLLMVITVSGSASQYGSASLFFDVCVCVCVDKLYIKLQQRHLHCYCCVISFLLENPGQKICVEDFFFYNRIVATYFHHSNPMCVCVC